MNLKQQIEALKNLPNMIEGIKKYNAWILSGGMAASIKQLENLRALGAWANSGERIEHIDVQADEAEPPAPATIGGQTEQLGARPGKNTAPATIGRLTKTINTWKKATAWMSKATISVCLAGPKARSKVELWRFVEEAGGPTRCPYNEQFETWRKALPPEYYDKDEKPKMPQIDDEAQEG